MSVTTEADYKSTNFVHKDLTCRLGEPTLWSLLTSQGQIKANASSIHTTLGGGKHGHLGLVIYPAIYLTVSNTPYNRPIIPTLNITSADTQYVLTEKRHQHTTSMQLFKDTDAVERAIVQKIVNAVDEIYLTAIFNTSTNSITLTIPQILDHLFENYCDVSPKDLSLMKKKIEEMHYNTLDPIDVLFTSIDSISEVAEMWYNLYSTKQKAGMAFIVLQTTKRFTSGLAKWDDKLKTVRNWQVLKCPKLTLMHSKNTSVLSTRDSEKGWRDY